MNFINKYLRNVKPYKLASHKIWAVAPNDRNDILKLDWNEATMEPSPLVKANLKALLEEPGFFQLYPSTLNETLLSLLAEYVDLPTANVQYFNSSDSLHEYICKVFISTGDPVLILGPSYDNFRLTCQANGANVYWSNYEDDFSFEPEKFESDIRRLEPALVYICNPNNPTGNSHDVDYIKHLLITFPDTLFLIDEAYYEFSGTSSKDLVLEFENILVTRTMSKAFALANFRVGYLIASKSNIDFINRIRNPKNLSTFTQVAAISALSDVNHMWGYVKEVQKAKDLFLSYIESHYADGMKPMPSAGNFIMIQFKSYDEKIALLNHLASDNIFVRDCTQGPSVRNCFRITIGTPSQMKRVLNSIDNFYAR